MLQIDTPVIHIVSICGNRQYVIPSISQQCEKAVHLCIIDTFIIEGFMCDISLFRESSR